MTRIDGAGRNLPVDVGGATEAAGTGAAGVAEAEKVGRERADAVVDALGDPGAVAARVADLLDGFSPPARVGGRFTASDPLAAASLEAGMRRLGARSVRGRDELAEVATQLGKTARGKKELGSLEAVVSTFGSSGAQKALARSLDKVRGAGAAGRGGEPAIPAPKTAKLPSRDPLNGARMKTIAQEWLDGNITSGGTARIDIGKIDVSAGPPTDEQLRALAVKVLRDGNQYHDNVAIPAGALKTRASGLDAAAVKLAIGEVNRSFCYTNIEDHVKKEVGDVLARVGEDRSLLRFAAAEGRYKRDADADPGAVSVSLVVDPATGRYAAIYAQEGFM